MAKRHPFKKAKPGEPIPVTARQLESFMLEHNGRFNSRDYDKFERMELMESPVRDAIHELKTYSLETLAQRFDVRLFGRGKRDFVRLDAEGDKWLLQHQTMKFRNGGSSDYFFFQYFGNIPRNWSSFSITKGNAS